MRQTINWIPENHRGNKQSQPFNHRIQIQTKSCPTLPHNWKKTHSPQQSNNVLNETLLDEGEKMGREYTGDPGQYLIDPQLSQGHHNTYNNFFFLSAYLIIRKEGPLIQGVENLVWYEPTKENSHSTIMATTKNTTSRLHLQMSPVEKKSIFSGSTLQQTSPEINTLGNKKEEEKGDRTHSYLFPWSATGDTGRNTFELDCPKKASVVSDQSDRRQRKKKTNNNKEQSA